ncbi:hypothetical protein [Propioniferax innocua]|uniref:HlyD family secretion protein n=1 Tax=Propioniferax innocua TaxID=1753 RepID=A0A542ZAK8_9ACTN|nr:hypothetical protein [Propioniferax innocua]TQL57331.1 hypothetical protein FB460_2408 [Propioniferax innocua]
MMYRFKALEKKRQFDQLDTTIQLARPRGWVAVFVILIVTALLGIWGFLGSIPRTTTASGLLGYPEGMISIQAVSSGQVLDVPVRPGSVVEEGEVVLVIEPAQGEPIEIESPSDGRIVSTECMPGEIVQPGSDCISLERGFREDGHLVATLFIDADVIPMVEPDQVVLIRVPGVNSRQFGLLRGRVSTVAEFPLAGGEQHAAPPTAVTVELEVSDDTPSGYVWTSRTGPDHELRSQTPITADIRLGEASPISLVGS